jgi:magnesium-transporting ATPase (P-type)
MDGLLSKLKTNIESGLTSNDLDMRVSHFGTNKKDPPIRTPFCTFFLKALDDFMLKLLLVCATVNVGFEVGFADDDHRSTGKLLTFTLNNSR